MIRSSLVFQDSRTVVLFLFITLCLLVFGIQKWEDGADRKQQQLLLDNRFRVTVANRWREETYYCFAYVKHKQFYRLYNKEGKIIYTIDVSPEWTVETKDMEYDNVP